MAPTKLDYKLEAEALAKQSAINIAQDVASSNYLILDTETTGFSKEDVVIQIAVTDHHSNRHADTYVHTNRTSNPGAYKCHGISPQKLVGAPKWADIHDDLLLLLQNTPMVLVYNSAYDIRLMAQTAEVAGLNGADFLEGAGIQYFCVQELAKKFHGKKIGLQKFIETYSVSYPTSILMRDDTIVKVKPHSAFGDCIMTEAVLKFIASQGQD